MPRMLHYISPQQEKTKEGNDDVPNKPHRTQSPAVLQALNFKSLTQSKGNASAFPLFLCTLRHVSAAVLGLHRHHTIAEALGMRKIAA